MAMAVHAVNGFEFFQILGRENLVGKRQAYPPHRCGRLARVHGPLFRPLDDEVRPEVLEGQAHGLLVSGGDGIDGDEQGDPDGDAQALTSVRWW